MPPGTKPDTHKTLAGKEHQPAAMRRNGADRPAPDPAHEEPHRASEETERSASEALMDCYNS